MRVAILLLAISSATWGAVAPAGQSDTQSAKSASTVCEESAQNSSAPEHAGVGIGIVLDEHLLTDASRDHDYNGGGEVTLSGERGEP